LPQRRVRRMISQAGREVKRRAASPESAPTALARERDPQPADAPADLTQTMFNGKLQKLAAAQGRGPFFVRRTGRITPASTNRRSLVSA
jgi:hypothetical protein